jgi:glycosyltransferase involved in cell wall biosynthesis
VPTPVLLQIVPALAGSVGRATLDAAQAVIGAGGTAIVASPGGAMLPDLLRLRASHLEVPAFESTLWARLSLPGRLAASVREFNVNLVLARSPATAWIAGAVARRLGVKWIATLHDPFVATGLLERLAERRQLGADAVIAVSGFVARDALRRDMQLAVRQHMIAPGINLDRFDPAVVKVDRVIRLAHELRVPDGRHVVLYPTRFTEDRGQRTVIDAIKQLDRPDVFCLMLGSTGASTAYEKELERAIEVAELNGRVQIGPYVEDMPAAYMLADVVLATGGPRQGFSRTIVEAEAMGRPVVAEDGGGAAEAIDPGVTGWLAPPGDPKALAQALASALSLSIEQRAQLARAARHNTGQRYGLAEANAEILQLYQRLAD